MLILSGLVGLALGCIFTTVYLASEYRNCKESLGEVYRELNDYKRSNKELLNIISHLQQEVKNNE